MKTSSVITVNKDHICILKQSYLDICEGDKGAALLLNYYIYWHDIKLEISEKNKKSNEIAESHGEPGHNDETLYQFHTAKELYDALLGMVGRSAIEKGIKILEALGYISIHSNPNKRYRFDNTRYFLVDVDHINSALSMLQEGYSRVNPKGATVSPDGGDGRTNAVGTRTESSTKSSSKSSKENNKRKNRFTEFWAIYPKKVAPTPCQKKWQAKKLDDIADEIIADITERIKNDVHWLAGYVPNSTTYLNQRLWEGEIQRPDKRNSIDPNDWEEDDSEPEQPMQESGQIETGLPENG